MPKKKRKSLKTWLLSCSVEESYHAKCVARATACGLTVSHWLRLLTAEDLERPPLTIARACEHEPEGDEGALAFAAATLPKPVSE